MSLKETAERQREEFSGACEEIAERLDAEQLDGEDEQKLPYFIFYNLSCVRLVGSFTVHFDAGSRD